MGNFQTVVLPWILISAVFIGMAGLLIWKRRKFEEEAARMIQEKEEGQHRTEAAEKNTKDAGEDHSKLGMVIGMAVGVAIAMTLSKQYGQTVILFGLAFGMIAGAAVGKCVKRK